MRVLHLAPPPQSGSGIAAYAELFRGQLRQVDVDVEWLDVPLGHPNSVRDVTRFARAAVASARTGDFDVAHAELGGGALREFWGGRALARYTATPLCLTVHDPPGLGWYPFHIAAVREFRLLRQAAAVLGARPARALEGGLMGSSAAAFCLSRLGVERLSDRYGVPRGGLHVLRYPAAASGAVDNGDGLSRSHLLVGFFGHWYASKGLEHLVDALAVLREQDVPIRARLYGEPTPAVGRRPSQGYRRLIVDRIRQRGLEDVVELPGHIPEESVAERLQDCDAIVLPYELTWAVRQLASTSASLHEAMAAGVPVVASDIRALAETVKHEHNGLLVPQHDHLALAAALRRLWEEPGLRERLRGGARATARAYTEPAAGLLARDVYESVT